MRYAPLWALIGLICLAGCGGGDGAVNAGNGGIGNTIVGKWSASTIQAPGGVAQSCPTSVTVGGIQYACGLVDTRVYHDGGAYDEVLGGQRGTWTVNGNTLTVAIPGQPDVVYSYSISGSVLTLQLATNGGPVTFTLQRQ